MLNRIAAVFLSLLIASSTTFAKTTFTESPTEQVRYILQVTADNQKQMAYHTNWLAQMGFDIAGTNLQKGQIEVITDQQGVQLLNRNNYFGKVYSHQQWDDSLRPMIDSRYMNPARVEEKLKALNEKYPQWTRLEQIGTSTEGRPVWALLVSTTPQKGTDLFYSKPTIIFDGMHHAREIMTPEVVYDAAEYALLQLEKNTEAAGLIRQWNIWVVPMLNVDGNNIVWTSNNMWRKNAYKRNGRVVGVDLNRNYAFAWNKCNGSSGSERSDTYRGPAAGSEPETQALMNLAREVVPTGSLSYHSYSEMVLYPYGCNGVVTGENALISTFAQELSKLLPTDNSPTRFYSVGTPWQLLYSVDGDSAGFMFGEFGTLSITFEINQSFQPSYDIREATVVKHRNAWMHFISRMNQNLLTVKIIDARTNLPTRAQIGISNIQLVAGEKPYQANSGGYFFKTLMAGNYALTIQLPDGRMKVLNVEMTGAPQMQEIVID